MGPRNPLLAVLLLGFFLPACSVSPGRTVLPATSAARFNTPELTSIPLTPAATAGGGGLSCAPTHDDGLSPSYKPDTPVRSSVGHGHVLTGVVLSSRDCAPIPNAKLELWPEYSGLGHPDNARATVFTDSAGRYRFECDPPEHIHMRISAPGYTTIAQNSYHPDGQTEGTFDIVLIPASS